MTQQSHIPPNLRDTVVRWSVEERLTSDRISERLLEEYGIRINGRNVRFMLERHRTELANAAKAIARDALRMHLNTCVQVFIEELATATWVQTEGMVSGNPRVVLEASRLRLLAAEKLLHFAGVDQPDQPSPLEDAAGDIAEVRASLMTRVESMVAELKRKAANGNRADGGGNGVN